MSSAAEAWEAWVHRVNPKLDRRGVHDAFLAGFAAAEAAGRAELAEVEREHDKSLTIMEAALDQRDGLARDLAQAKRARHE